MLYVMQHWQTEIYQLNATILKTTQHSIPQTCEKRVTQYSLRPLTSGEHSSFWTRYECLLRLLTGYSHITDTSFVQMQSTLYTNGSTNKPPTHSALKSPTPLTSQSTKTRNDPRWKVEIYASCYRRLQSKTIPPVDTKFSTKCFAKGSYFGSGITHCPRYMIKSFYLRLSTVIWRD